MTTLRQVKLPMTCPSHGRLVGLPIKGRAREDEVVKLALFGLTRQNVPPTWSAASSLLLNSALLRSGPVLSQHPNLTSLPGKAEYPAPHRQAPAAALAQNTRSPRGDG
jgi:hypothetical protein